MKYLIGVAVLIALVLFISFIAFQRFGVDIHVHDTYWVVPTRTIAFWILVAMATVSLLIAIYKLARRFS